MEKISRRALRRLRLRDGDILLVDPMVVNVESFADGLFSIEGIPDVAIMPCFGSIRRLSRDYVERLLRRSDGFGGAGKKADEAPAGDNRGR